MEIKGLQLKSYNSYAQVVKKCFQRKTITTPNPPPPPPPPKKKKKKKKFIESKSVTKMQYKTNDIY